LGSKTFLFRASGALGYGQNDIQKNLCETAPYALARFLPRVVHKSRNKKAGSMKP